MCMVNVQIFSHSKENSLGLSQCRGPMLAVLLSMIAVLSNSGESCTPLFLLLDYQTSLPNYNSIECGYLL